MAYFMHKKGNLFSLSNSFLKPLAISNIINIDKLLLYFMRTISVKQ